MMAIPTTLQMAGVDHPKKPLLRLVVRLVVRSKMSGPPGGPPKFYTEKQK